MTAWDTKGADPLGDLRKARDRWEAEAAEGYPPPAPYVISPRQHAKACELLGLPEGSPLTNAQVEEAAWIEYAALTDEQRAEVDVVIARMWGPW